MGVLPGDTPPQPGFPAPTAQASPAAADPVTTLNPRQRTAQHLPCKAQSPTQHSILEILSAAVLMFVFCLIQVGGFLQMPCPPPSPSVLAHEPNP